MSLCGWGAFTPAQIRMICLSACVGVGMRVCICVWVHAWKSVNTRVCVCVCVRARVGDCMSAPIIYLLQAIVFWLLWFGGVFTIRFVGSPLFLLILSGQANYFFIPFKGTRKPNKKQNKQKNKQKEHIKFNKII